jgi:hypothetical protein
VPANRICKDRLNGQVAQSVERRSEKPEVDGSTPSLTTKPLAGEIPEKCT